MPDEAGCGFATDPAPVLEFVVLLELIERLLGLRTDDSVDLPIVEIVIAKLLLSLPNFGLRKSSR